MLKGKNPPPKKGEKNSLVRGKLSGGKDNVGSKNCKPRMVGTLPVKKKRSQKDKVEK